MIILAKNFLIPISVWKRQSKNWRIVSFQSLFRKFFQRLTESYQNIYIAKLGANPIQLGIVNSFSNVSGAIMAAPFGWLQDKYSLRKIFFIGAAVSLVVTSIFALATNWVMIILAMVLSALVTQRASGGPSIGSCHIICDVSVKSEDRSTCKGICDGFFALPSLIAPTLAALIITYFGGISVEGIRPLYWIQLVAGFILFIFLVTQLTEIERPKTRGTTAKSGFIGDYREVFRGGTAKKRWIIYSIVNAFTLTMMNPFTSVFANEIKLADQFVLGR